jgi:hypothetical protein
MGQLISEIWEGLRNAGLPEVMLYLPDQSASRCHWRDTALIGDVRVALLADQDRQIVRILPVDSCVGIGVASPKGVDPSGYKTVVYRKLREKFGGDEVPGDSPETDAEAESTEQAPGAEAAGTGGPAVYLQSTKQEPPTPEPPTVVEPVAKPDTLASRWALTPRAGERRGSGSGVSASGAFIPLRRP